MRLHEALKHYQAMGLKIVPCRERSKKLGRKAVADRTFTPGNFMATDNVGIMLGEASGDVCDLDFDCREARELAPVIFGNLPSFGRVSAMGGHMVVRMNGHPGKIIKYHLRDKDRAKERLNLQAGTDDKCVILEVRCGSGHTVFPPSIHPSEEAITWHGAWPNEFPTVEWDWVDVNARLLAFLSVIARAWNQQGIRHDASLALAGVLVRQGLDNERITELVRAVAHVGGDEEWQERTGDAAAARAGIEADAPITGLPRLCELLGLSAFEADLKHFLGMSEKKTEGAPELPPTMRENAQKVLNNRGEPLLRFNSEWLTHRAGAYRPREEEGIRAEIYETFPRMRRGFITDVMDALKALIHVDRNAYTPPCWLDGRTFPDPAHLLVLRNGILDLATGELSPHDPALLTRNALDFDYDPAAPAPERWLRFLREIWPDEADCRDAIQQMFGYLLTPDTAQQKIFVLVGPTRCGKGTIGRVLVKLLGRHNVCAPTLSAMGEQFGLQSMIGKQLALVSDMRMGARTDKAAVAETLLRISGEDTVSVPRKNMTDWEGRLAVRFVIMSNEAPTLNDPSGALLGRYIVMQMRQSFLGREDRALDDQLMNELPGILNWAIEGWSMMRHEGRLAQPASAGDLTHAMSRLSSPIAAFVEDECELDSSATIAKDELYTRYKRWCEGNDMGRCVNGKEIFGKDLLTAFGQYVSTSKPQVNGARLPSYKGLKLRPRSRPEDNLPF